MGCFLCSADGLRAPAVGVCISCGCAACDRHGDVEIVRRFERTGNLFEQRPVAVRRFSCAACRSLIASQVAQGDWDRADRDRIRD